jgi:hypothetical protein
VSFYPSLHIDDVKHAVSLKICENCQVLFTRDGAQRCCDQCVSRYPWLGEPVKKPRDLNRWWRECMRGIQ